MIGLQGKTLRSARLACRLLEEGDKAALAELLRDARVTAPAGFLPAASDTEFDAFFAQLTAYNTALAVLCGGVLIGYIRVNRYRADLPELAEKSCVSTGFVIGEAYQRRGYGTEMLKTVTDYLLQRFDACFADCFEGNEPSAKTIEKCGYRYLENYTMFFDELDEEKTCRSYVRV